MNFSSKDKNIEKKNFFRKNNDLKQFNEKEKKSCKSINIIRKSFENQMQLNNKYIYCVDAFLMSVHCEHIWLGILNVN